MKRSSPFFALIKTSRSTRILISVFMGLAALWTFRGLRVLGHFFPREPTLVFENNYGIAIEHLTLIVDGKTTQLGKVPESTRIRLPVELRSAKRFVLNGKAVEEDDMTRLQKLAAKARDDWSNIILTVDGYGCFLFDHEHAGSTNLENHHFDSSDTWEHDQEFHLGEARRR